jgi:hypothetical protein
MGVRNIDEVNSHNIIFCSSKAASIFDTLFFLYNLIAVADYRS